MTWQDSLYDPYMAYNDDSTDLNRIFYLKYTSVSSVDQREVSGFSNLNKMILNKATGATT